MAGTSVSRASAEVSSPGARQDTPAASRAVRSAGIRASAAIRPTEPSFVSASSQAVRVAVVRSAGPTVRISKSPADSRMDVASVRSGAMAGSSRDA